MAKGTTTVDFGAFPGSLHATVDVIDQANIVAGSLVEPWLFPDATADHSADEHLVEPIRVTVPKTSIIAGTGFTIHAAYVGEHPQADWPGFRNPKFPNRDSPRAYGVWNVAWAGDWT